MRYSASKYITLFLISLQFAISAISQRTVDKQKENSNSRVTKSKLSPDYCLPLFSQGTGNALTSLSNLTFGVINFQNPDCGGSQYLLIDQRNELFQNQTLILNAKFGDCGSASPFNNFCASIYIDWNSNGVFTDPGELIYNTLSINTKKEIRIPITVPSLITAGLDSRMRVIIKEILNLPDTSINPCSYANEARDFPISFISAPSFGRKPSPISFYEVTGKSLWMNWQDNSASETGYQIERSSDGTQYNILATLPSNKVQFKDSTLIPGKKYYYRINSLPAIPDSSTIDSISTLTASFKRLQPNIIETTTGFNSGAFWSDANQDGKSDLYISGRNKLFINTSSGFVLTDILLENMGNISWADYDNDGDNDFYAMSYVSGGGGEPALYENNGNGTFTRKSIFIPDGEIFNCAWSDYNKDGRLDLLVSYKFLRYSKLYRNNLGNTFSPIKTFPQTESFPSFADIDNDGDDDLIITGSQSTKVYTLTDSTFTENLTTGLNNMGATEGISWADFNNDGQIEPFAPHFNNTPSELFVNIASLFFLSYDIGSISSDFSRSSSWADFDNDGFQDLFISRYNNESFLLKYNPNYSFSKMPISIFDDPELDTLFPYQYCLAYGCTWSDYNQDGFPDLYIGMMNGNKNHLYTNLGNTNNWIQFQLQGVKSNRNAVGARISIKSANGWQYRWIQSSSGAFAQNDYIVKFGIGSLASVDSIIVNWPSGLHTTIGGLAINQLHQIVEPFERTFTWNGTADSNWHNPLNWDTNEVPHELANVIINSGVPCIVNSPAVCNKLNLMPGAVFTANASIDIKKK